METVIKVVDGKIVSGHYNRDKVFVDIHPCEISTESQAWPTTKEIWVKIKGRHDVKHSLWAQIVEKSEDEVTKVAFIFDDTHFEWNVKLKINKTIYQGSHSTYIPYKPSHEFLFDARKQLTNLASNWKKLCEDCVLEVMSNIEKITEKESESEDMFKTYVQKWLDDKCPDLKRSTGYQKISSMFLTKVSETLDDLTQ